MAPKYQTMSAMLGRCTAAHSGLAQQLQGKLGQGSHGFSILSSLLSGLKGASGPTEVCFIDPRAVLKHKEWQTRGELERHKAEEAHVCMTVSPKMLDQVSKGTSELADMDDPANHWVFGDRAEMFEYSFLGVHPTKSGYTSIIKRQDLQDILSGHKPSVAALPSWDDFRRLVNQEHVKFPNRKSPFLFAGYLVDSSQAAVYKLEKDNEVVGVLVSSEFADASDE